jgi:hypothetical protein
MRGSFPLPNFSHMSIIRKHFSVKPPLCRSSRGEYGSNTLRRSQGIFEPYSPLTSQGKVVLQFILRPPGSIWIGGSSIWKAGVAILRVGGGIRDYVTI